MTRVETLHPLVTALCTHRGCPWMPLDTPLERLDRGDALKHAERSGHTVHVTETVTTIYRATPTTTVRP